MFDIGFSELLLFGVIALIVLGPEKLPQAARTAGRWYSKIRRTVSTLQSEIEAELDLAETRQQMQKELAKIRQTEAEMRREMAEMRGSMQEFESSQNQDLKESNKNTTAPENYQNELDHSATDTKHTTNKDYAYENSLITNSESEPTTLAKDTIQNKSADNELLSNEELDSINSTDNIDNAVMTRPWENMWFRLGAYDKARRLPAPPYLPNYKADILLYSQSSHSASADKRGDT